jgi:uncharacterized membrane protein YeaQ/YmgE (transglycosylase-associated protein family)
MDVLMYLIVLVSLGLITGAVARLALPGPDPMSIIETVALGLAGSSASGLIALAVSGRGAGGLALSVICATAILYLIRRLHGGGLLRPVGPTE